MGKKLFFVLAACALIQGLLLGPIPSQATPILDFEVKGPYLSTASISYAGGSTPLIGTDIAVTDVLGLGTPLNSGVELTVSGGILNFTTGNFTSSTLNQWSFGSGGTIEVTGGINALGIADGSTLLSGQFISADVTTEGLTFKIAGASFLDQKIEELTDYYGMADGDGLFDGYLNISFFASGLPPCGFNSSDIASGDVANTVPEPTAMLLLGFGLAGLAVFRGIGRK